MILMQWLNENSHRAYPLLDGPRPEYTQIVQGTKCTIPDDFLLDFQFASYTLPVGNFRLYRMTVYPTTGTVNATQLTVRYTSADGTIVQDFFVDAVGGNTAVPYTAMRITNGSRIVAVFGDALNGWLQQITPTGTYQEPADPQQWMYFEPALASFQSRHRVERLKGDIAGANWIYGDILAADGYNVGVALDRAARMVQLVALPGNGLGRSPTRLLPARPNCDELLLTINGVYADGFGDIRLKGGRGIDIVPDPTNHTVNIRVATTQTDINCERAHGNT